MTYPSRFTTDTTAALVAAGWRPARTAGLDVMRWEAVLESAGLALFPEARRLLLEFGGLRLATRPPNSPLGLAWVYFDPTTRPFDGPLLEALGKKLGTSVLPIGEEASSRAQLAVGADRRVFLLSEPTEVVGGNIDRALENLINSKRYVRPFPRPSYAISAAADAEIQASYSAYACTENADRYFIIADAVTNRELIRVNRIEQTRGSLMVYCRLVSDFMPAHRVRRIIREKVILGIAHNQLADPSSNDRYVFG